LAGPREVLEVDFSEVRGRSYNCIDGCALCCLCQPELLPHEEEKFMRDPRLRESISDKHISPEVRGVALKLQGRHGACCLLKDKRCAVYKDRPHFCRAFPVNVFVGWRIQVNANLSCRGIGLDGESLDHLARTALADYEEADLRTELDSARAVFREFEANARGAKVSQSLNSVRGAAEALVTDLTDELGLSRVLTYAEHGRTRQNVPPSEIARLARRADASADISERATMDGVELFDLDDLSMLPVYIDESLQWKIFQLRDKHIVGLELSEDGETNEISRTDPAAVELMPLSVAGRRALEDYLRVVNSRDCFFGHAAYLCDLEGYEYNLAQVYMGAMANNALDLWWRASFLAGMTGASELGQREIREGIVFFDMDLMDLPTIGAFI
jgi:Fe-S-cluster containining protein